MTARPDGACTRRIDHASWCGGSPDARTAQINPLETPVGALVDPFLDNSFMMRGLVAGVLVAIACAVVGTLRHPARLRIRGRGARPRRAPRCSGRDPLGISGMLGAAVAAAVMIAGSWITRRTLSSTTAIGLLFVGMLALGVVIVSRSATFTGDLTRILFGDILGTSWGDIWIQLGVTVSVVALAVVCARPFLMLCFDAEQAKVAGFDPRLYEGVMLGMIAATVVVSFQSVGTLLVLGMLLAPAGTAALVTSRIPTAMVLAGSIGSASVAAGLLLSYHFDLAAGRRSCWSPSLLSSQFSSFEPRPPLFRRPRRSMSAVRLRGLAAGYGDPPVVDGLELELPPGATLALVGTNGSGKSTILRTLAAYSTPAAEPSRFSRKTRPLAGEARLPRSVPRQRASAADQGSGDREHGKICRQGLARADGHRRPSGCAGGARAYGRARSCEPAAAGPFWRTAAARLRRAGSGPACRPVAARRAGGRAGRAGQDLPPQRSPRSATAAQRSSSRHTTSGMPCAPTSCSARAPRGGARPALGRPHARGSAGDVRPRPANACRWRPRDGFGTRPRRTRPRGRPPPLTSRQVVPDGGAPAGAYALRRRIEPESARRARPPTARPARTGTVAATGSVTSRRSPQARAASVVATAT